jgi:FMN phosphatase YigB (HAD superfamily)
MAEPRRIAAIAFDAYGTLFDVYSIGALAEALFPGSGRLFHGSGATSRSNIPACARCAAATPISRW